MNFDDLPTTASSGQAVPVNYNGFTWEAGYWGVESDAEHFSGPPEHSDTYPFPSAPNGVYNGGGTVVITLLRATPFDFNGAAFAGEGDHP